MWKPLGGMLLETKVHDAATACLDRLYKEFHKADHPDWHKVIERCRKGDGDALEAVGHKDDPDKHPVCAAVLARVGSGKKGSEVRKHFALPAVRLASGRDRRRPDRLDVRRSTSGKGGP